MREKLVDYVRVADVKKIKAMYTMVEDQIDTAANDWDDEFVAELDRRSKEVHEGTAKIYTWEQTKRAALARVKSQKK